MPPAPTVSKPLVEVKLTAPPVRAVVVVSVVPATAVMPPAPVLMPPRVTVVLVAGSVGELTKRLPPVVPTLTRVTLPADDTFTFAPVVVIEPAA